jgi:hypothetical protein
VWTQGIVASLVAVWLNDDHSHMKQEKVAQEIKEMDEGVLILHALYLLLLHSLSFISSARAILVHNLFAKG